MTQDAIWPAENRETILLYTGNIMTDGGRGRFLNTTMSKNNAELVNSLRNIRPTDDEEKQWQWKDGQGIRLQNPESEDGLLSGETTREEFDITVKLFFVRGASDDVASRRQYAEEALRCVAKALGVDKFDTLILSFPGITLEKDEEDYNSKQFPVREETVRSWVETWKILESYQKSGTVKALGISEFGILRLDAFIPHIEVRPFIDQINLRDCCDVPSDLLDFSMAAGIKLMPHMDEDDPLPKDTLQQVLGDLKVNEKVEKMRWVVKYTAVVKQRGVIENKGYVVSAQTA